jgi:3-oxoacyl-[acyl-carrier-protein] synthase-1
MNPPLAIVNTGLVTSVGLSAPATCAALRAGLTNPSETRFFDSAGELIMAHQVPLEAPWRGRKRLVAMASMALAECLDGIPRHEWARAPLFLCVAEPDRPGRLDDIHDDLFTELQEELDAEFSAQSLIIPHGRVSIGSALVRAQQLVTAGAPFAVIAACDSLISGPTLSHYDREQRLLTPANSNGFMPGEGAAALLVTCDMHGPHPLCTGIGFALEPNSIQSEEPLRADGLTQAVRLALAEADIEFGHLDFRIADLSGESYYFKEATLAMSRILRTRKEQFDIWHPAECIGETGAVVGLAMFAQARAACLKAYAPGPNILCHASNDAGERLAAIVRYPPR